MKNMKLENKVAYLGVFTASAVILGYVEALIPFFAGFPGMKLGLANIMVVIILYVSDGKCAVLVSILRILIVGALFANFFSVLYSLAGASLSLTGMIVSKKSGAFSIKGVSMIGGVLHNIGQIAVAMIVVETMSLIYYLPVLLISGVITGLLVGLIAEASVKRLKRSSDRLLN